MYPILYIDKEHHNLNIFNASLRSQFHVYTSLSEEEAYSITNKNDVWIIIADQTTIDKIGIKFLRRNLITFFQKVIIIVTVYTDTDLLDEALKRSEIFSVMKKPYDHEGMIEQITEALRIYFRKSNYSDSYI